eukprot:CAMPEP_0119114208 /NCGR_PEP_ID=MMETSP1180-20130426/46566_1 /TAXON_ID=3052 ORGANISM="Chlamydomonas cf sp, Strain CCMP681" /NCGR_SAMPLE_ID=MMETSP1180 /ASSEMBLY_ACC=CAM_ASM_000741 /LENGTH=215 /DNA_ID=CAMNT_0007102635 /DNA_START=41 /DNA_END=685 /DNA_ORIENTATION=-
MMASPPASTTRAPLHSSSLQKNPGNMDPSLQTSTETGRGSPARRGLLIQAPACTSNLIHVARNSDSQLRSLRADYSRSQNEVEQLRARLKRIDELRVLEVTRLRQEADFHQRQRQVAEQRAIASQQQRQAMTRQQDGFDEAQAGLIGQSQLLVQKNAELQLQLQLLEQSFSQAEELKQALEAELGSIYEDRDRLEAQLAKLWAERGHLEVEGSSG